MTLSAVFDAIAVADVQFAAGNLGLFRQDVYVPSGSDEPPVRLSVLDIAPAEATCTLVLVHGFAANGTWWRSQLSELAQHYRVIVPDLRGHGLSAHSESGYTISQFADDIAALLDALDVRGPVVIGGHSIGAFIAAEFAARHPARTARVIIVAGPLRMGQSRTMRLFSLAMHVPDGLLRFLQPVYELDPRGTANLVGLKHLFRDAMDNWNGEEKYPLVKQPALVIEGQRDLLFAPKSYRKVAELLPNSELVNISVSKHQIPLERPKAMRRAIERFVEPHSSPPPAWRSENDAVNTIEILAQRPWLGRYPGGMPPNLLIPRAPLTRLLDFAVHAHGGRSAISFGQQRFTYRELAQEVARCAASLAASGIKQGDRIMLCLPNLPHFPIALFAAARLGAVAVLTNPVADAELLEEQAQVSGARLLLLEGTQADLALAIRNRSDVELILLVGRDDYEAGILRERRPQSERAAAPPVDGDPAAPRAWWKFLDQGGDVFAYTKDTNPVNPADPVVIGFTGGSDCRPIALSHHNLLASTLQLGAWFSALWDDTTTLLSSAPLSSLYGLTVGLTLAFYSGGRVALLPGADDPERFLQALRYYRPTLAAASPPMYRALNARGGLRRMLPRELPLFLSSGAPLPVDVQEVFRRLTRAEVVECYGLTEAGYITHVNPLHRDRTGSAGLPLPNIEARLVDRGTGETVPTGAAGELWLRGPQIASGALAADGWLHTGDMALMDDDGYFRILGELEDVWQSPAGELIYTRDVTETIHELPGVLDASVVPLDGALSALVQPVPGHAPTPDEVRDFCRQRLPENHVPVQVVLVDKLPRTPTGKLRAAEARRLLATTRPA